MAGSLKREWQMPTELLKHNNQDQRLIQLILISKVIRSGGFIINIF